MKTKLVISLVSATILALGLLSLCEMDSNTTSLFNIEEANAVTSFTLWSAKYGKQYFYQEEKYFRFNKYLENAKVVKEHNARYALGLETFDLELNQFADMDNAEFSAKYLGLKKRLGITKQCKGSIKHVDNPPTEWDWLSKGAVGHVANQGSCGSCWAFSTIGSLEGLSFIEKGTLLTLSQQQLVDCSSKKDYQNQGCNGGYMDTALMYVIDNGITDAKTYPYTAQTQTCRYKQSQSVYRIQECAQVPANKTASLVDAVIAQPVSISVEANHLSFQLYKSGVYSGNCGHNLDHGILLTGYGVLNGKDYWKARNSWGASWGQSGYIYIAKGGDGPGQCGILMQNAVPQQSV